MGSITEYKGKRGTTYHARVRINGVHDSDSFKTHAAASRWIRSKEGAIVDGVYKAPSKSAGTILHDAIEGFENMRKRIGRPIGKSFAHALQRQKTGKHSLDSVAGIDWLKFALQRIEHDGVEGQTVASELAYMGSVLKHAAKDDPTIDPTAPGRARTALREMGLRVVSRERNRRITDAEIDAILKACDDMRDRTVDTVRDLVEFALATAMRRARFSRCDTTTSAGAPRRSRESIRTTRCASRSCR